MSEAVLSVARGRFMLIVVVVVVRVLVLDPMAVVMVRVMRLMGMRVAVVVLDTVMVRADDVVKRHVDGRQDFETGQPKQADQHGADTNLSRSSIHSGGR